MLHIPLLITFNIILLAQPIYSMEKETKETRETTPERKNKFSLTLRKKSADTPSPKQTPRNNNNDDISLPSISFTASSTSTSADRETSRSTLSKPKPYSRSKTVDSTSTTSKETTKLKLFSSSDGATPKISPRAMLTSSFKNLSQVKTAPQEKINILTNAVKDYNLDTIQDYINNSETNLNQTDQWGNTALHHAVVKLTEQINNEALLKKIINIFLQDPRTDSSIARTMDGRRASDIFSGGQNPAIRTLLFARTTLDTRTNHEIGKMLLESYIHNIALDDNLMKQTIECIKEKIRITEKQEGKNSIDLPQEATLPDYATDEFILHMIKYRIPEESHYLSEAQKLDFKNIFQKETDTIILNVSIDINEESIQESIENILKIINQSHPYLTKFTTKPCIFEILKACVDQKKQQAKIDFSHLFSKNNSNH